LLCVLGAALGLLVGPARAPAGELAEWESVASGTHPIDVGGPRKDGRFVVAAGAELFLFRPGEAELAPFAQGEGGYSTSGAEPYIALSNRKRAVKGADCSFRRDDVYAIQPEPSTNPGVVRVTREGIASRFAELPDGVFLDGIAFDTVGRFGHRLLVMGLKGGFAGTATLYGVDCDGEVKTFAEGAPVVEGGMAIAPRRFGRFVGRLVAASEFDGNVYAFGADGSVRVVAESGLPVGQDEGIEGVGFAPRGFGAGDAAYMADVGTSTLLTLRGGSAHRAGVRGGDLLAPAEENPGTVRIRCSKQGCDSRLVATGPASPHREGHVVFGPAP
jgi:hypothetical protein